MKLNMISLLATALLSYPVTAQLSGTVGPTTTRAEKAATKVCNVLDYGAVASETSDIGPPLASAWAACVDGGEVYIPAGNYGMETFATLTGAEHISIRLDGIIYRYGTLDSGTMISIEDTTDFEMFSSTSAGAIQGYGYVFHAEGEYGPRILRLTSVTDYSVHDMALVDAGAFHLVMDTCTNGEVYNMIIRGANEGGLDGVDVWGTNIWIHDVEVTNKDECVTVKSPSSYILVESIYCNWSGGCAIGSLGADTAIDHIEYNDVYSQNCNQMMLIKSNGGSGSAYSMSFNNFIGHTNAYTLDIDSDWSGQTTAAGDGVEFFDISFTNWHGTCSDGDERAPIQALCPAEVPCYEVTITTFDIWTESGDSELYKCENAYGTGGCLETGTDYTTYTTTSTIDTAPTSYSITTMAADLTTGFGLSTPIPIPTVPSSYFPGLAPYSALLG